MPTAAGSMSMRILLRPQSPRTSGRRSSSYSRIRPASLAIAMTRARLFVIGNYTRYRVCLVRGEGSYVWDAEGKRYLDFFPGWGCGLLGHCPPRVVEAIRDQIGRLIHVPNTWYTEPQGLLGQALSERSGFRGQCFF